MKSGATGDTDLPAAVGKPALRAFRAAGLTRLEQFAQRSESELSVMHGVGPKAIGVIRRELAARGQSLRRDD